jgi:dUTPase
LLQLCAPALTQIYTIFMVDSIEELGTTRRGIGGFGSTGI